MNQIAPKVHTGTLGELLVQIRLLQHGVQAAPPVKDSGNDLIAVNGREFRAVSVRTTTTGRYNKPKPDTLYEILAVVCLVGKNRDVYLDQSWLFLIPKRDVAAASTNCKNLARYTFSRPLLQELFGTLQP